MKKVLALVLVLGMASLANAGLIQVLSVNGDDVVTAIELTAGQSITLAVKATYEAPAAADGLWLGIEGSGEGTFSNAALGIGKGSTAELSDGGYTDGKWLRVAYPTSPAVGSWANGNVLTVTFTYNGPGQVALNLYDAAGGTVIDTVGVTALVPEPATMALLGLGGLFFARKK